MNTTEKTGNLSSVIDILDVMQKPPVSVTADYIAKCVRVAALLGNPVSLVRLDDVSSTRVTMPPDLVSPWGSVTSPLSVGSDARQRNIAFEARSNVFDVVDDVSALVSHAAGQGVLPSRNPFSVLASINSSRIGFGPVVLSEAQATEIMRDISAYLELLTGNDEDRDVSNLAQLSSVRISFDGFGGTGNAAEDLLKLTPDSSSVRETKLSNAAALFDFSKRMPRVVFTANYAPDGDSRGALVGWRRIPDASGYIVLRRNFFDGQRTIFTLTNERLRSEHANYREYAKTWVMSFYDELDVDSIWLFADPDVDPDGYYFYYVQAFQNRKTLKGSVFSVPSAPSVGSASQRLDIKRRMEELDPGSGEDKISPYPVLAQYLLGDSRFDWVLAGVNIRASIDRREPRSVVMKYSYLTAQMDFLLEQMKAGKFVVPKDVNKVVENVNIALSGFGVSQVIDEVLRDTGILFHFDGTEVRDDSVFNSIGSAVNNFDDVVTNGIIAAVLSAADPETATIDLLSLAANLPILLDSPNVSSTRLARAKMDGRVEEIGPPNTDEASGDDIQHFSDVDPRDGEFADLTSFDGLSKFVRTIRLFADFGRDRADVKSPQVVQDIREQTKAASVSSPDKTPSRDNVSTGTETPPRPGAQPPKTPSDIRDMLKKKTTGGFYKVTRKTGPSRRGGRSGGGRGGSGSGGRRMN